MSEPAIVAPVIWGSNAPGGVGQVGSLAANTPTLTSDPAVAASLPAFQSGWVSVVKGNYPALQDMDGQAFYITSQIAAMIGQGMPGWFSTISYNKNSFVSFGGQIYVSLQNTNINNTPAIGSLYWQALGSSLKGTNVISNGGMQVNQYGASGTITTSSGFTLDRWTVSAPTGTINWSQAYANTIGNCLQLTASGTTAAVQLRQKIESLILQQINSTGLGANCIIQAYIFNNTSSAITPVLSVLLPTAQDNYASTVALVNAQNLQTIPANTGATVAYNFSFSNSNNVQNGAEIIIDFGAQIASGSNVQIGLVDLSSCPTFVVGGLISNPPAASIRRYTEELFHCQRYYQTWGGENTNQTLFQGFEDNGETQRFFLITFNQKMRIGPALTYSSLSHFRMLDAQGDSQTPASLALNQTATQTAQLLGVRSSGGNTLQPVELNAVSTSARFNLSSEIA